METQPTFAERTAALKEVAVQLRAFGELIMREAQRMEAAGQRFANRSARRLPAQAGEQQTASR